MNVEPLNEPSLKLRRKHAWRIVNVISSSSVLRGKPFVITGTSKHLQQGYKNHREWNNEPEDGFGLSGGSTVLGAAATASRVSAHVAEHTSSIVGASRVAGSYQFWRQWGSEGGVTHASALTALLCIL